MRKAVFAFVVLVVLAMAVPASAQIRWGYVPQTPDGWYYAIQGNKVGMLTADNLGMVHDLTNQLRRSEYRSLRDDLRWNSGYGGYGLPIGGGFYPMYDRNMRPMSRREATVTYGTIGAGIGYGVSGNLRGTVIGTAGGAILGLLTHRGNGNTRNVVVTPPSQGQGVYVGPDGIPVAVGTRPGSPVSSPYWGLNTSGGRPNCMAEGMVTLENQSNGPLRVFRSAEQFEVIQPKEQKCAPLEGDYTGQVVGTVIGSDGLTGRVTTAPAKPQSLPGLVLVWR